MAGGAKVNYYGISRVRRSLIHFATGKSASAVASLAVVVITIRELPVSEYAVFVTLQALVMMVRTLTSFGVNAVLLRYLPDLRVVGNNRATYAMMFCGIVARALLFVLLAVPLLYFAGDRLARALNLGEWAWLLGWYLLTVGLLRVLATFTGWAMESLLWQKQAQYSIAVAMLLKLAAVLALIYYDRFDLENFVKLEFAVEALSFVLLISTAFVSWRRDPHRHDGTLRTLRDDARRYLRFAFWAYLFNFTTVLHGSAPNRLIVSHYLGTASTALFGAVDRLIQYVKQYEPVKLLIGLVRPVFNAQYQSEDDFGKILRFADGIFRFNLIILIVPLLPFAVAGETLFDLITAGKYAGAAPLFLGFYFVLALGSFMLVLELIVKAVELNSVFTISNLLMSGSVLIAIPFLPTVGLWALVAANSFGYIAATAVVLAYLAHKGFAVRLRLDLIGRIIGALIAATVAGRLLIQFGAHPALGIAATYAVYAAFSWFWLPFTDEEVSIGRQLLQKRMHREPRP
ncbi:MAG TPA: lipopolysaccharide biosynthesis protein [Woeseiaceae bacterium]|nr:lipopolysaccharide biosynthesis protein [Woeseiaceae bacterium]